MCPCHGTAVTYIIYYDKGSWKNQVLVVADDENYAIHMEQAEEICSIMENSDAHCFINKVYTDAYTAEIGSTEFIRRYSIPGIVV